MKSVIQFGLVIVLVFNFKFKIPFLDSSISALVFSANRYRLVVTELQKYDLVMDAVNSKTLMNYLPGFS